MSTGYHNSSLREIQSVSRRMRRLLPPGCLGTISLKVNFEKNPVTWQIYVRGELRSEGHTPTEALDIAMRN